MCLQWGEEWDSLLFVIVINNDKANSSEKRRTGSSWVICRVHFNSGPSFHALVIDTSLKLSYIHYSLRLQNPFRTHRSQIPTPASSQILKSLSNSLLHSFKTPKILSNGYAMSPWFVNHTSNTWPSVTHRVCMDTACCRGWQIWVIC